MIFAFLQVFSWYMVLTYCGAFSFIISEYHISSFILLYIAFPSLPSSCQESGLWQSKLTAGFWNQWSELLWRQQVRHFPQPLLKPQSNAHSLITGISLNWVCLLWPESAVFLTMRRSKTYLWLWAMSPKFQQSKLECKTMSLKTWNTLLSNISVLLLHFHWIQSMLYIKYWN